MNVDPSKRSALVKFKTIEAAEAAAAAYFNKAKDEHILGYPQIRVKYVTQPAPPGSAAALKQAEESAAAQAEAEEEAKKRKIAEMKRENALKRKALIEKFNSDIQMQVRRLNTEEAKLTAE